MLFPHERIVAVRSLQCVGLFCLFLAGTMSTPMAAAQESPVSHSQASDDESRGKYVLQGWLDARIAIETAEFEITGKLEATEGSKRFERSIVQDSAISPENESHRTDWGNRQAAIWLQLPDRVVQWCYGAGSAAVVEVKRPDERNLRHCRMIDPLLVTVMGNSSIPDSRTHFRRAAEGIAFGGDASNVKEKSPGVWSLTWTPKMPGAITAIDLVVSEEKGFSVERSRMFEIIRGDEAQRLLISETASEWQERDGIWIPVSVVSSKFNPRSGTTDVAIERVSLDIHWKSVNEPIDSARFDVASFGAREGKSIKDYRSSKSGILISKIGKSGPNGEPRSDPPPQVQELEQQAAAASPRLRWLLIVNAVLFFVIGLLVLRRYFRRGVPAE